VVKGIKRRPILKGHKQLLLFMDLVAQGKTVQEIADVTGQSYKAVSMMASRRKISLRKVAPNVFFADHVLIGDVAVWYSPEDYEWIKNYRWHIDYYGYCSTVCKEYPKARRMHQFVIDAMFGKADRSKHNIHHKDYVKLNNRRENLHDFPSPKAHFYFERYICKHPNNPRFGIKEQDEILPF